jgi:hypothetical protein
MTIFKYYAAVSLVLALIALAIFAWDDLMVLLKRKQPDHKFGYALRIRNIRNWGVGWCVAGVLLPIVNIGAIAFVIVVLWQRWVSKKT